MAACKNRSATLDCVTKTEDECESYWLQAASTTPRSALSAADANRGASPFWLQAGKPWGQPTNARDNPAGSGRMKPGEVAFFFSLYEKNRWPWY